MQNHLENLHQAHAKLTPRSLSCTSILHRHDAMNSWIPTILYFHQVHHYHPNRLMLNPVHHQLWSPFFYELAAYLDARSIKRDFARRINSKDCFKKQTSI